MIKNERTKRLQIAIKPLSSRELTLKTIKMWKPN